MKIEDIQKLKDATEKLSKWESTGQAFGHFENIKHKLKGDNIYEFYCCLRILQDLQKNYTVTLIRGTNGKGIFPGSPAFKKGWSYFTITPNDKTLKSYQVCYGTKVRFTLAPDSPQAPDISFQKADADLIDPFEKDVLMIMDAKFKNDRDSKIDYATIKEFKSTITDLGTRDANKLDIKFDKLKAIVANCLITNAKGIKKHEKYCENDTIKQVYSFSHDNAKFEVIG